MKRIALVGTGHIGGSLVLALRAAGRAQRVIGFDANAAHAETARKLGILDEIATDAAAAARGADLTIFSVPVGAMAEVIRAARPEGLATDVGSTKRTIVAAAQAVAKRFVGSHPLAGLERTGPEAADASIFRGRHCFLTPADGTDESAVAAVEEVWRAAGAIPVRMDPGHHDALMAAVSHLPHAVAYALTSAIAAVGPDARGLTSGGFRDTTRIASSDPVMWRDIFLENRDQVLPMLARFGEHLERLRKLIEAADGAGLERELSRIRAERAKILG